MRTIVIGAGASGLMAAGELSRKGVDVTVLESGDRIGGRVHTFVPGGFTGHVEAGAEFIHGELPITLGLMKKAGLPYVEASLKMETFRNGKFRPHFSTGSQWKEFEKALKSLGRDCTLTEFLDRNFPQNRYAQLRREAFEMAAGLDLADAEKLSVFCIREEWTSHERQYRPVTGYAPLLEFLAGQVLSEKGKIALGQRVELIKWEKGSVTVLTDRAEFKADNVIVTVSLGNLQKRKIAFEPPIDDSFFSQIGFGEVIKIAMEFEHPFWESAHPDMGFLFTEGGFTFWTQLALRRPLLIGWIGNDSAPEYAALADSGILGTALSRLEQAFPKARAAAVFRKGLVFRYTAETETNGGYSWTMPQSRKAIRKINEGISETIWFAGEAFHFKADVGTVEAAFHSGRYTARKVFRSFKK